MSFRTRRARFQGSDDGGFTLVESLVALLLAASLFTALAGVLVSAVKTSVLGRQNQQATDLMTQRVEQLRLLDHSALSLTAATDDEHLVPCASGLCLPVRTNGTTVNERVIIDSGGAVTQTSEDLNSSGTNRTTFTRRTYVTEVTGQPVDQVKRVTVFVTWDQNGKKRTRSTSTLVAYTQRGLPVPVFKLSLPHDKVVKNPGARQTFVLTLSNQGAPDRWNLSLLGSGAADGWTLARDTPPDSATQGDGIYDPLVDLPLTDTTGDGIVDTGRLGPSETLVFFLTRQTAESEPASSKTITVEASSVGQPPDPADPATAAGYASVTATAVLVLGPVPPDTTGPAPTYPSDSTEPESCPTSAVAPVKPSTGGYSLEEYVLHNEPVGDTTQQRRLYMNRSAATQPQLGRYSTDVAPSLTGRHVLPFGTVTPDPASLLASTDFKRYADWSFQTSRPSKLAGKAVLRIWVSRADAGTSPVAVHATVFKATSSGTSLSRTAIGSGSSSVAALSCPGFQEVFVPISLPETAVPKETWFGVRVTVTGADPVRLAYDVPAAAPRAYPASLTVGRS